MLNENFAKDTIEIRIPGNLTLGPIPASVDELRFTLRLTLEMLLFHSSISTRKRRRSTRPTTSAG